MTFLASGHSIGRHGGGTHQWDVLDEDVQYGWRVHLLGYATFKVPISRTADKYLVP